MVKRNMLYDSKLGMLSDDQLVIEFDMEVIENTNYSIDSMVILNLYLFFSHVKHIHMEDTKLSVNQGASEQL